MNKFFFLQQVSATDKDSGTDGDIKYTIQFGNVDGKFAISDDGNVTIFKQLDRETTPSYTLTIAATDNPSTGTAKQSTITLVIAVGDVNDNPPIFTSSLCQPYVSDDVPLSTNVITVRATDADSGKNADIEYRLVQNNSYFDKYFTLNPLTGYVKVKSNLNLDMQNIITKHVSIDIIAEDKGLPPLNTTLNCTIIITGENRFAPVLSHYPIITKTIPANVGKDYYVIKINATDADFGTDGELSFVITDGDVSSVYTISNDGELSLLKTPTSGFYYLTVTVSDKASIAKRKLVICNLLLYYLGKPIPSGIVYIGAMNKNPTITMVENLVVSIPIYIQVGIQVLEGFHVNLTYDVSVANFVSSTSDFITLNTSNVVQIVGLVNPSQSTFGIIEIAVLKFQGIKNATLTLSSSVIFILDQDGRYIPVSTTPSEVGPCSNSIFSDVNLDCQFNIADAAFTQSYVRAKNNFAGSNSLIFKSLSLKQTYALDSNQNGVISYEDARDMLNVLTGRTVAIKKINVAVPDSKTKQCLFTIGVDLYNDMALLPKQLWIYAVFTYTNKAFSSNVHTTSNSKVKHFSFPSGVVKYGDVMYLTKKNDIYVFSTSVSVLPVHPIGVTLVLVAENSFGIVIQTMFVKNTIANVETISLPQGQKFNVSSSYLPQKEVWVNETTHRCLNPLETFWLGFTLLGDYDVLVKGHEAKFRADFKVFYETYEANNNRSVTVKNVTLSKGSIIVNVQVEHLLAESKQLTADLTNTVKEGSFSFTFNSVKLTADKTVLVDGKEQVPKPHKKNNSNTAVIIIVVVVLLLLLIVVVIILYYYKVIRKRRFRKSVAALNETEFCRTPSYRSPSKKSERVPMEDLYINTIPSEFGSDVILDGAFVNNNFTLDCEDLQNKSKFSNDIDVYEIPSDEKVNKSIDIYS